MKINLTKKQYLDLLKLVYMGNWMANAIRVGDKKDPKIDKFVEMEQYIFSFAKEYDFDNLVEFDEHFKRFFPTREFEDNTDIEELRENYDDEIFWDELHHALSRRDFLKNYTKKELDKMDYLEIIHKEEPFREKWAKEIDKHGIDRLEIID